MVRIVIFSIVIICFATIVWRYFVWSKRENERLQMLELQRQQEDLLNQKKIENKALHKRAEVIKTQLKNVKINNTLDKIEKDLENLSEDMPDELGPYELPSVDDEDK